jgi:hypothetical protein
MIVARLLTTVCLRHESRGIREANIIVPDFSRFAVSPWEPGNEQTD